MVVYCFVKGCTSSKYKKQENQEPVSFYGVVFVLLSRFPSDPNLRAQWVKALAEINQQLNVDALPKYAKICNLHFRAEEIEKHGFRHFRLKPNS
ncbi:uncharacterized protein LOC118647740 [Monomorium pharaonis]|uniref:uncharacterized protein LOC118647740 n=1 Tax=Monomorium pharaonis TaxID=307658 RepID=UPI00174702F6|nr:uncharacterized protein LOC118647740 [Monomorium pharaonis]